MSFSTPFILRPIATTLLATGMFIAGAAAYFHLPVASLPAVDFPTLRVSASRPGNAFQPSTHGDVRWQKTIIGG